MIEFRDSPTGRRHVIRAEGREVGLLDKDNPDAPIAILSQELAPALIGEIVRAVDELTDNPSPSRHVCLLGGTRLTAKDFTKYDQS